MADLKGTKTEQNLLKAFAGESQARNRYTFFASAAKKEGLVQISMIFEETANQEKEHGKKFFKYLQGGPVTITETFPAGVIGSTLDNLKAAADGEQEEWTHAYPEFARIAREEGFEDIAKTFEMVSVAEKQHGFIQQSDGRKGFQEGQCCNLEMSELRLHSRREGSS